VIRRQLKGSGNDLVFHHWALFSFGVVAVGFSAHFCFSSFISSYFATNIPIAFPFI
jgi:hypothetical protein